MPSFAYTVMQDLYALGEAHEEAGLDFAANEASIYADYADNVSKQLNDGTPRTLDEYKTEFVKRMQSRVEAGIEHSIMPELLPLHQAVSEYLTTLLPKK